MLAPSVAELRQGSLVQYYPWDAAGEWGWFWQGASRRFVPLSSVERAPKGDSPDAGLWQGYARSGSAVARTAPTESAPAAHSFAQGDACSFYRWDAAGEWGWYWRGEARYYVRLSDFDLVAPGSASDKSLQWGWLPSDVRRYEAPSLLSAPGGTAPGGRISQFYLWDGSGEWGWCWVGSRREYFPLDGVELLPKNDAPDLSLQSGTALAALEGRAYPSASAPALASVASGTRMQFYLWDAARTWGWFWRGETKVYFPLADVKVDPKDPMIVKAQNYTSTTPYLILVDTAHHKVGVFKGSAGYWNRVYYWDCADGAPATPTVKGSFTVGIRGYYFDSANARCFYYTQFYGNYLFHSTLYYQYPTPSHPMDSRLGMALSHGCVRLHVDNAKWIYDNIPYGTKVVVY